MDGSDSTQQSVGDPFADTIISGLTAGVPGDQMMTAEQGAIASFLPSLPWYVWAGVGIVGFIVLRDLLR